MYQTPKEKITGVFKKAAGKVKDVASDIMTAPIRMKVKKQMKKDTENFNTLKTVQANEGKPDSGDYRDPLFRARVSAKNIKFDADQAAAKAAKKAAK